MTIKTYILNFWVFIPLIVYLILFTINPLIEHCLDRKCTRNFIVDIDLWLFSDNIYLLFSKIENTLLDIISSIPYLIHFTLPFIYSIFLIRSKIPCEDILRIAFSFGFTNMIGVLIQYIIPTPPPWMILMEKKIPEANFFRVDNFFKIKIFKTIYSHSKLTCGAFPSLHTSWPSVILFGNVLWASRWICISHVFLIAFSAIYSMHHYIIDVLSGILLAYISSTISNHIKFQNQKIIDNYSLRDNIHFFKFNK